MKKVWISALCTVILAVSVSAPASAAPSGSHRFPGLLRHYLCVRLGIGCTHAAPTPTPAQTPAPTAIPTAAPTVRPTAAPTAAPQVSLSADAAAMLGYINGERTAAGLPALVYDASLAAGALAHSRDMTESGFFSHTSPTRGNFSARLAAAGLRTRGAGENIARYGSLEKAHAALMASDGHRANILSAGFTHVGLGIIRSGNAYCITQWFARMD